jgi:DNA-binding NarL/FixJ family response regulator
MSRRRADPINVLLIADPLTCEGVREILSAEPDLRVVAAAGTAGEAVSQPLQPVPQVVVLFDDCHHGDIMSAVSQVGWVLPNARLLVLTRCHDPGVLRGALGDGATVLALNVSGRHELIAGLRAGNPPGVREACGADRDGVPDALTEREIEVLGLVAKAMSNGQIARQLGIVEGTVKRHLRNIFTKLGACSRIDAVNKASETIR